MPCDLGAESCTQEWDSDVPHRKRIIDLQSSGQGAGADRVPPCEWRRLSRRELLEIAVLREAAVSSVRCTLH